MGRLPFLLRTVHISGQRLICRKNLRLAQFPTIYRVRHNIPLENLQQLPGGDLDDLPLAFRLLQILAGLKQQPSPPGSC